MELLDEVIETNLNNLKDMESNDDGYKNLVDCTSKLLEQRCELKKIELDSEMDQLKMEVDTKMKKRENTTKRIEAGGKLVLGLGYVAMLGVGLVASLKVDNLGSIITSKTGNIVLSAISKLKP